MFPGIYLSLLLTNGTEPKANVELFKRITNTILKALKTLIEGDFYSQYKPLWKKESMIISRGEHIQISSADTWHLFCISSGPTGNVVKINTKEEEKRKSIYTIPKQQITSPLLYEISSTTTCETRCYKKSFLLSDCDCTEPDSIDINYLSGYGV